MSTKTSNIYGDVFETKNTFVDLRGHYYVPELCHYAETNSCAIYSWKSFKEGKFKSIGRYKFVSKDAFPDRSFKRYFEASQKCTDLSNLYPLDAFRSLMNVSNAYFSPQRSNHDKIQKVTFNEISDSVFVVVPEIVMQSLRDPNLVIHIVTSKDDEQWYDEIFYENGIRYGVYRIDNYGSSTFEDQIQDTSGIVY